MRRVMAAFLTIIASAAARAPEALAQTGVSVGADALFYGDNTEFRNPFREGETIFGAAIRLDGRVDLSDRVTLTFGFFGNQRFGSDDGFDQARPIAALAVTKGASTFIFGTLATPRAGVPAGPDRTGPHGLLPPLQREVLAFERPYEAGLQWRFDGKALQHDLWLNWQRLNTPEHRERLDGGGRLEWRARGILSLPLQAHIVHEGGQLYASGPVRDSVAAVSGVILSPRPSTNAGDANRMRAMLELYALVSHDTPDRTVPERTLTGGAFFGRASAERRGWRAHLIAWRGDDFVKDEGDANYQSLRRNGTRYRGVRDYAEAGLTRTFAVAPGALIEGSFRLHRVERHYEYSYRVLAIATARARIR